MKHQPACAFDMPSERDSTRFVFLLLDGFSHLDFACALEPLRLANLVLEHTVYDWRVITENGTLARCSSGLGLATDMGLSRLDRSDCLVVISGYPNARAKTEKALHFLRREAAHGCRIIGIGGGVHILAEAGLLDGLDCAVHWQVAAGFSERYPKANARLTAFVEAKVSTAAGGTAAADLILHAIRRDHGCGTAQTVADLMVYRSVCVEDAPQTWSRLCLVSGKNRNLAKIIKVMEENIEAPLSVGELAVAAHLSTRQIQRLFERYLGESPARYYLSMRLDRARNLLHQTDLSIMEIVVATGFVSASHFSKCFRNTYGMSPHAKRAGLSRDTLSVKEVPSLSTLL